MNSIPLLKQPMIKLDSPVRRSIVFLGTAHDNGGSSILASELARAMSADGYDVEQWYLFGGPETPEEARVFVDGSRSRSPFTLARIFVRVLTALREKKPDVVFGLQPLSNLIVGIVSSIAGIRRRVATHHTRFENQNRILMRVDGILARLPFYTDTIACSHSVADSYSLAGYPRKMTVILNAQKKPKQYSRTEARSYFGLRPEDLVIGQIGRITAVKNQVFTVELLKAFPDARLLIVGKGPDDAKLRRLIDSEGLGDRVQIVGDIDHARIGLFYAAVDAMVFPSVLEGMSLAAIEAIHSGVPMVCSDIASFREMFSTSAFLSETLLVPLSDRGRWVEQLRRVLTEPVTRKRIADELAQMSSAFSFDNMVQQYLGILQ